MKADHTRHYTDNKATWLQMASFLTTLKIWKQNASGFRRDGSYSRENTAPAVMFWGYYVTCWGAMSCAGRAIFTYSRESLRFSHWCEWVTLASTFYKRCYDLFQTFLAIYNHYVIFHCLLLFLYICYLQRKQLSTWPSPPLKLFHWFAREIVTFVSVIHMV